MLAIPSHPSKPFQFVHHKNIKPFAPLAYPSTPDILRFIHGKFA
jgi:hypothetical protein